MKLGAEIYLPGEYQYFEMIGGAPVHCSIKDEAGRLYVRLATYDDWRDLHTLGGLFEGPLEPGAHRV